MVPFLQSLLSSCVVGELGHKTTQCLHRLQCLQCLHRLQSVQSLMQFGEVTVYPDATVEH